MNSDDKDTKIGRGVAEVSLQELGSASEDNRREHGNDDNSGPDVNALPQFRLYKRRHFGVLGIIALNIVAGMNLTWFGPISNKSVYLDTSGP